MTSYIDLQIVPEAAFQSKTPSRWSLAEHTMFLIALDKFGARWRSYRSFIDRPYKQIQSHGLRHFKRRRKAAAGESKPFGNRHFSFPDAPHLKFPGTSVHDVDLAALEAQNAVAPELVVAVERAVEAPLRRIAENRDSPSASIHSNPDSKWSIHTAGASGMIKLNPSFSWTPQSARSLSVRRPISKRKRRSIKHLSPKPLSAESAYDRPPSPSVSSSSTSSSEPSFSDLDKDMGIPEFLQWLSDSDSIQSSQPSESSFAEYREDTTPIRMEAPDILATTLASPGPVHHPLFDSSSSSYVLLMSLLD